MVIFNSYVKLPEGNHLIHLHPLVKFGLCGFRCQTVVAQNSKEQRTNYSSALQVIETLTETT
jgi:hypothetical protein